MIYIILILIAYYYGNYMNHIGYERAIKEFTEKVIRDKFGNGVCNHPNKFREETDNKIRKICFGCEEVISEYIK